MDGPSSQLQSDLNTSVSKSLSNRHPILHHLNSDTSWLLQLPRPLISVQHSGRHWFNILIDPWLSGSQSDVAAWFSEQWHSLPPAVGSIAQVEELALEVESLSSVRKDAHPAKRRRKNGHNGTLSSSETQRSPTPSRQRPASLIDAIAISHEFTDHCHKATLLECHPDIPVLATTKAAKLIRSWHHFRCVLETPIFPGPKEDPDWRHTSISPLPEWLGIGRLLTQSDALYYHSAIMITFTTPTHVASTPPHRIPQNSLDYSRPDTTSSSAEAIIYTPHGIHAPNLSIISRANPPISTLAFLHGLHDIQISSKRLNLGGHNGLQAQRLLKPKYWIGTHDAQKASGGLVSWFLKRKAISLEDALKEEAEQDVENGKGEEKKEALADVDFKELGNGESMMLG